MLNSASDYKFIDVSQVAGRIHGNIMPVLSPSAYAPAKAYFEDYLFCLEAYHERMDIEHPGDNSISVAPRTIIGKNIYDLGLNNSYYGNDVVINGPLAGYAYYGSVYINQNTTHPNTLTSYSYSDPYSVTDYMQNYALSAPETKLPYVSLRPRPSGSYHYNTVMWSEFIRAKYWAFNSMNKVMFPLVIGDFATDAKRKYLKPDGSTESEYSYSLYSNLLDSAIGYSISSSTVYQRLQLDVTYKDVIINCPYAVSAEIIYHGMLDPRGGSQTGNHSYAWTAMKTRVTNGTIKVPSECF